MESVIFVILLRLLLPLAIFRWPLGGGLLSIIADASDVIFFEKFGTDPFDIGWYHFFDKVFDTYYLSLELVISRRWTNFVAKETATLLFAWRFTGVLFFEITEQRQLLALMPNIFENFYLAITAIKKFFPNFLFTGKRIVMILIIAGIPKLVQEYIMHYKYPGQTWPYFRDRYFQWLF